jgi:hypothetical protein
MVGRVDGTAAFRGERGYVFLFNPNYRPIDAEFTLDRSIGLAADGQFVIRQLYPEAERGKLLVHPSRVFWRQGERVQLTMPGAEALVLEIGPAPESILAPLLFGAVGRIGLTGERLELADVPGEPGTEKPLKILLPPRRQVGAFFVNGVSCPFSKSNDLVSARLRFGGRAFDRVQQIGAYRPDFAGGVYQAQAAIPERVFQQLRERRRKWSVAYTDQDLLATWLGSDRLLLFVNVAEPLDTMPVRLKVDDQPVALKPAYTSVYPRAAQNTFVGWSADLSSLAPEVTHRFEVEMPPLQPGQFQGLFLDTVETDYTREILR